jgi:co-chaperonin GroES (HSP10)
MTKIVANTGKMVIKQTTPKSETLGGIILPNAHKVFTGTIISLTNKEEGAFSVGDFVIFAEYSGVEIEVDGEKLLVINVEDALVKVEN